MMSQWFKKGSQWRTKSLAYPFLLLIQQFQVATRSTSPDMTTVFHTWPQGRFKEITSNLRRDKLRRMNQGSNFLGGSFSNIYNARAPVQFRRESQHPYFKRWFSPGTDPSPFTSIAPVFLDRSNKTSWVFPALKSTSHFLPQSVVSIQQPILVVATDQMPDHI